MLLGLARFGLSSGLGSLCFALSCFFGFLSLSLSLALSEEFSPIGERPGPAVLDGPIRRLQRVIATVRVLPETQARMGVVGERLPTIHSCGTQVAARS